MNNHLDQSLQKPGEDTWIEKLGIHPSKRSSSTEKGTQQIFSEKVALRYRLYKALMSELPFENMSTYHVMLTLFVDFVSRQEKHQASMRVLVEKFFASYFKELKEPEQIDTLFKFVQFIERQVTLFDALEEASFEDLVDLHGEGTVKHLLARVKSEWKLEQLEQLLETYRIRVVLTAHPTQFYPTPVLMIIYELYVAIKKNDLVAIQNLLLQLGRTPFKNKKRPTPEDEAESILVYLCKVFYEVIPTIEDALEYHMRKELHHDFRLPTLIEMGFWPGGDRDGNPYVTAETTLAIAEMLKKNLIGCYIEDMRELCKSLTFKGVYQKLFNIKKRLVLTYRLATEQGKASPEASSTNTEPSGTEVEPYRELAALLADLNEVIQEIETHHNGLFVEKLEFFVRKVRAFGFYFATIDIRQNQTIHHSCVLELLTLCGTDSQKYEALAESEQIEFLLKFQEQLSASLPKTREKFSDRLKQLFVSLASIETIQQANGEQGLNRYIISNTESTLDVVELCFLFHAVGVPLSELRVDIIPLFETIDVLKRAHVIMKQLYALPSYKEHLARRGNRQVVMVGYSDGTKDGGYLSANWCIFRAKETVSEVSRELGIKVIFFDGRGGPPARGGGESNLFYRALSDKTERHEIQLTVQGQTISSNFSTVDRGRYNLEQLLTAGIENQLFLQKQATLKTSDRDILSRMGEIALVKYEALKSHPQFIPYLETITPLRFFRYSNVGSRPTKRSAKEGLNLNNLRAIPFVASWNQLKQNIPAYYGFGSALEYMIEHENRFEALQDLYRNSIFFRALIGNTMQALMKTDFTLTYYLREDKQFGEIWKIAYEEAELTKRLVLRIAEQRVLLEDLPLNRLSIQFREHIVRPLLAIQQYALFRLREDEDKLSPATKELLEKLVIRSLIGSINASRNSA